MPLRSRRSHSNGRLDIVGRNGMRCYCFQDVMRLFEAIDSGEISGELNSQGSMLLLSCGSHAIDLSSLTSALGGFPVSHYCPHLISL